MEKKIRLSEDGSKTTLHDNDKTCIDAKTPYELSDQSYILKEEDEKYFERNSGDNVELVTRSLFFDSVPKRKGKRRRSRMKRDILRKASAACLSPNKENNDHDLSTVTIRAIQIHSKESSISSLFTSENSYDINEKRLAKDEDIQQQFTSMANFVHSYPSNSTILNELSNAVGTDPIKFQWAQRSDEKNQDEEKIMIDLSTYMFKEDREECLNIRSEMDSTNREFISSLPSQFLSFIGSNPTLFEFMPMSLEKALDISSHARILTEARFPFRIIHTNAGFYKLGEDSRSAILGKPLSALNEISFLKDFLVSLDNPNDDIKTPVRKRNRSSLSVNNVQIKSERKTGILPKCFIKLIVVGKNTSSSGTPSDKFKVTHFLIQIETNTTLATSISSTLYQNHTPYAHAIA